jgi:hypothetical protein
MSSPSAGQLPLRTSSTPVTTPSLVTPSSPVPPGPPATPFTLPAATIIPAHQASSPLARLPAELLLMIAEQLPTARDKAALARTCRRLHTPVNHHLYTFNVRAQNGTGLTWAAQSDARLPTLQKLVAYGADINDAACVDGGQVPCLRCGELPSPVDGEPPVIPPCELIDIAARHGQVKTVGW